MSDGFITQVAVPNYSVGGKIVPLHLVILKPLNSSKKTPEYFVAVKLDEGAAFVKAIGFYYEAKNEEVIAENYAEIIKSTDPNKFVECRFPYYEIRCVRGLIYKHKHTGEKK